MRLILILFITLMVSTVSCRNGRDGAAGASGLNGTNGIDGVNGVDGINGQDGLPGPAGQDGTEITVVKFCGEAASYPSTFPEVGLCIDGQLYAVYSTNGGFLALIPPGTYNSNAVGSSCNFTVQANCVVTH